MALAGIITPDLEAGGPADDADDYRELADRLARETGLDRGPN